MNPLKRIKCTVDCPEDPFDCKFFHNTGEEFTDLYGFPRYFCPHEWEITAVKNDGSK